MKTIKELTTDFKLPSETEENLARLLYLRRKLLNEGLIDKEDDELDYLENWLYELF